MAIAINEELKEISGVNYMLAWKKRLDAVNAVNAGIVGVKLD